MRGDAGEDGGQLLQVRTYYSPHFLGYTFFGIDRAAHFRSEDELNAAHERI